MPQGVQRYDDEGNPIQAGGAVVRYDDNGDPIQPVAKPPVDQLGEAWQAAKDLVTGSVKTAGHAAQAAFGQPQAFIEDLKGLIAAHQDQYQQAKTAFHAASNPNEPTGQRIGQALIGTSHALATAIPMQGPMAAGVSEDLSTGHYGRAAVNAAAVFSPYAKETAETVGAGVERAGSMVGATKAADALNEKWRGYQDAKAAATTAKGNQAYYENLTKAIGQNVKDPAKFTQALTGAKPYLVAEHANTSPLESIVNLRDAADTASDTIHEKVGGYVSAFATDLIRTDPLKAAQTALEKMPGSTAADVTAGMKEMAERGIEASPTLGRSFDVLTRLNAENKSTLAQNNYDIANTRAQNPQFVAREAAAASLRSGIYDQLAARGVPGVRELRRAQGDIITVRNAAQKQINNGQRGVSGTGKSGPLATMAGKAVEMASVATGAKLAGPIGAAGGHVVGKDLASSMFARANQTRDALVAKAFKKVTAEPVQYPEVPAPSPVRGLLTAPPIVSAVADPSYARAVPGQYPPLNPARLLQGRQGIPLNASPDASYVRAVRGDYPPVDPAILEARSGRLPFAQTDTPPAGRPIPSRPPAEPALPRAPGVEPEGRDRSGPAESGALAVPAPYREHFAKLVPDARAHGYQGSVDSLAEHYNAALREAKEITEQVKVSDDEHTDSRALLQAVSKAGGIGLEAESVLKHEVSRLLDDLHGGRTVLREYKTGFRQGETYIKRVPKTSAGIPGFPGVIKAKGGNSLDMVLEDLEQDAKWKGRFASMSDFLQAIEDAIHHVNRTPVDPSHLSVMSTLHDLLKVREGEPWWEAEPAADTSFEFGANVEPPAKDIIK